MRQIAIARPATSDNWNNAVIGWSSKNGVAGGDGLCRWVRVEYIKPQRSPGLKKHFFGYDALTMTLDQTRYSDHWLKMVLVISRGSGFGCRLSVFGSRRSFSVVSVFARTACTAFALQRFAAGRSNLKS